MRLLGKGRKIRLCPLWPHTTDVLRELLGPRTDSRQTTALFLNVRGSPITRHGIHDLVARTVKKATQSAPSLRSKRVSPHTFRHATAVHMLRSGIDINTIRAWLGHVSVDTTNQYAEVDLETKAKALDACAVTDQEQPPDRTPSWHADSDLMAFLSSL